MNVRFQCRCGQKMSARAEHAGKRVKCPKCDLTLEVPVAMIPETAAANPAAESPVLPPPVNSRSSRKSSGPPNNRQAQTRTNSGQARNPSAEPDVLVPLESESPPVPSRMALWLTTAGAAVLTGIVALVLAFNSRSSRVDNSLTSTNTDSKTESEKSAVPGGKQDSTLKTPPKPAQKNNRQQPVNGNGNPQPIPAENLAVANARDLKSLQGRWKPRKVYRLTADGAFSEESAVHGGVITITNKAFLQEAFEFGSSRIVTHKADIIRMDATKTPAQLQLRFESGPFAGKSVKALYRVGDSTLDLLRCDPGMEPPSRLSVSQTGQRLDECIRLATASESKVDTKLDKPAKTVQSFEEAFRAGQFAWMPVKNIKLTTTAGGVRKTEFVTFATKLKYDTAGRASEDTTGQKTYNWPNREATFGPGAVIRLTQEANVREGKLRSGDEWTWTGLQWTAGDRSPMGGAKAANGKPTWRGRVLNRRIVIGDESRVNTTFHYTLKLKSGSMPPAGSLVEFTGTLHPVVSRITAYRYSPNGKATAITSLNYTMNNAVILSTRRGKPVSKSQSRKKRRVKLPPGLPSQVGPSGPMPPGSPNATDGGKPANNTLAVAGRWLGDEKGVSVFLEINSRGTGRWAFRSTAGAITSSALVINEKDGRYLVSFSGSPSPRAAFAARGTKRTELQLTGEFRATLQRVRTAPEWVPIPKAPQRRRPKPR